MSKKINKKFLDLYAEIEKICREKLGIVDGEGFNEYIKRLENTKFAPKRDEVLPQLQRFSNIRAKFAKMSDKEVKKDTELLKRDIKWLKNFKKEVSKKKDPLAKYLKKARSYVKGKKVRRVLVALVVIAAIAAGAFLGFGEEIMGMLG